MEQKRDMLLDGIKGIAIIFVVVTHFSWTDEQRLAYLFPYWIDMAVPVFMIISGYVSSLSMQKQKLNKLSEAYKMKKMIKKLLRFLIPFLMIYVLEIFLIYLSGNSELLKKTIYTWVLGGFGPGSYYVPIMIQFIFLFPCIYMIVSKYKDLKICFGINLIYEILKSACGMSEGIYRLLLFRYIFLIAAGCYLAVCDKEIKAWKRCTSFLIGGYTYVL